MWEFQSAKLRFFYLLYEHANSIGETQASRRATRPDSRSHVLHACTRTNPNLVTPPAYRKHLIPISNPPFPASESYLR